MIVLQSCSVFVKRDNNKKVTGISVTQNFPIINASGKLIKYDTSNTRIYYYQNKILFVLSYHFDSIVQNKVIKSEIRFYRFVYKKEDKYGYITDSNKLLNNKKVLVDSVLKNVWALNIDLYTNFSNSYITEIFQKDNKDLGTLSRYFHFKLINDSTLNGTCSLWFTNKINDIPYSLSKELDSIYKMKLYKVRIVNNPRYFKDYGFTLDKIEQAFDLEEIQITNESELLNYFESEIKQ